MKEELLVEEKRLEAELAKAKSEMAERVEFRKKVEDEYTKKANGDS